METSVFGFYFDEIERNVTKRNAIRKLLKQVKDGIFEGFISQVTYAEIAKSDEPHRSRDLKLIEDFDIELLSVNESEVSLLYGAYIRENILKERYHLDLLHIAVATVSSIDVLVTYNCEHIANEKTIRLIKSINLREGFRTEISIRVPDEVIRYE